MKYLKKYKIFENKILQLLKQESTIKNLFLDLIDKDLFYFQVYRPDISKINVSFSIFDFRDTHHRDNGVKQFELTDDFFDALYTLDSYLKGEDYRMSYIDFRCRYSYGNQQEASYGKIQSDSADNIDDLKRIIKSFGYKNFISMNIRFKNLDPRIKEKKINESRFEDFRKTLEILKSMCLEFEDRECKVEIFPKDDIKLNLVSLRSRGLIKFDTPFYLEIDITESKQFMRFSTLPDWFIENCRTIEGLMDGEYFETLPSVRYGVDWENFDTIDELSEQEGLFYKVRLEFRPTK